jgi:hypothetical protein
MLIGRLKTPIARPYPTHGVGRAAVGVSVCVSISLYERDYGTRSQF